MSYDDPDDEDSYDDEDEPDDFESAECPECGAAIHSVSDKCPACGYWLSAADRRSMWSAERKPRWLIVAAWVALALFLIPLIALVLTLLRRGPSSIQ